MEFHLCCLHKSAKKCELVRDLGLLAPDGMMLIRPATVGRSRESIPNHARAKGGRRRFDGLVRIGTSILNDAS